MKKYLNWVLPIIISAVVCSFLLAFVTTRVAYQEFHWAAWTSSRSPYAHYIPALAEYYRHIYSVGWLLPIVTTLIGFLVLVKKLTSPMIIACWVGVLAVVHLGWFLLSLLVLYLINQTFIC